MCKICARGKQKGTKKEQAAFIFKLSNIFILKIVH